MRREQGRGARGHKKSTMAVARQRNMERRAGMQAGRQAGRQAGAHTNTNTDKQTHTDMQAQAQLLTSSIKMIEGCNSLAMANSARTSFSLQPRARAHTHKHSAGVSIGTSSRYSTARSTHTVPFANPFGCQGAGADVEEGALCRMRDGLCQHGFAVARWPKQQ